MKPVGLASGLPMSARAQTLALGLLTHVGTPNDQGRRATHWDSQLTSGLPTPIDPKTILRACGVLECLSYDLVLILVHSIFLRPTRFASPFIVRHSYNRTNQLYKIK
jgi:hypothetical protein